MKNPTFKCWLHMATGFSSALVGIILALKMMDHLTVASWFLVMGLMIVGVLLMRRAVKMAEHNDLIDLWEQEETDNDRSIQDNKL